MTLTHSGPANATTDSKTGLRYYDWQGRRLMSVTSMRRLVGMPYPLAQWMQDQAIKAAMANESLIGNMLQADGPEQTAKWLRKIAMGERDDAANKGTAVHDAAALKLMPSAVPTEVAGPLMSYYDFLGYSGAQEIFAERQVFNLTLGFAGSIDSLLKIGRPLFKRPRKLVVDYKTGKGIYADHALQLMSYAMGEFIGQDDVIDQAATAELLSADGLALLHLTDTSWELIEIQPTPALFDAFKAMVTFAAWQRDNPSIDGLVTGRISK